MEAEENSKLRSPWDQGMEATEPETSFFYFIISDENEDDEDDAMEFYQDLRLLYRAYFTLPLIIYPGVNRAREIQTPALLVRQLEQHSQNRIHEVDDTRLCGPSLPIEPIACSLWVGVGRGQKKTYESGGI
jgi:hypothetical protein